MKIGEGNYTFSFDFWENLYLTNLNGFIVTGREEFFLRYWSIKSYVLFSIPSSSLSLSLFFSPLERTFRISKDNPCDRNVSRASNVYRANWTKMMKEGKRDVLLPPSPSSRDAKEQILARKMPVGSVKRCKPVENRWNFSSLSLSLL